MILLAFLVLGGVVGLLAGGNVGNIAKHGVKCLWLPIAAFLLKGLAPYAVAAFALPQIGVQFMVALMQYGMLLAFAVFNWRWKWWPLAFGAGSAMNAAVMLANGGVMPVAGRALQDISPVLANSLAAGERFGYTLETAVTRLAFLGDVIVVGFGETLIGFASVGDIFIGAGGGLLLFGLLRVPKEAAVPNKARDRSAE